MSTLDLTSKFRLSIMSLLYSGVMAFSVTTTHAALDDLLANQPLANSTTVDILPNIAVMLDDSGSMDEENMPDGGGTNSGKYCYLWHNYNKLAYNPAKTYLPPIKLDGTIYSDGKPRYPDAVFTSALKDGYFPLNDKQYNRSQDNTHTNLESSGYLNIGGKKYYSTHNTNPSSTTCDIDNKYTAVGSSANIAAPGVATGSTEAKTNYANWYSYYRKRAFVAKVALGEAFYRLNQDQYRIGLFYINSKQSGAGTQNDDLKIEKFSNTTSPLAGHRVNWFNNLYNTHKDSGTPNRGALSRMGRMYGGKITGWDPVQYSCQRNYTILMTDGYWNPTDENSTYGPKDLNGNDVGDMDNVLETTPDNDIHTASRPSYAPSYANSLADVAYYYYHTDLRNGITGSPECTAKVLAPDNTYKDVCENNVPPQGTVTNVDDVAEHQHMTTFTVGLGVNGTLTYLDGYRSSNSGDYYQILNAIKNWPTADTSAKRIDDLWHAAVSGRGTYYSAKDKDTLGENLKSALDSIRSVGGSGAAAATSNLQPTPGVDQIYIASYRTVKWDGELTAYKILNAGQIDNSPLWTASSKLASIAPSARMIFTSTKGQKARRDFLWGNLTSSEQDYFKEALDGDGTDDLSQYSTEWSSAAQTAAVNTPQSLVGFLRGEKTFSYSGTTYDLYRPREKVLGDIVHAQPVFVKTSFYPFVDDPTYGNRPGTVYVGANDGMLHAFDESGNERWAYIPPFLMKNLWRLADKNYVTNHRFFVDGPIAISDVQIDGKWQTILVGAVGKGGRGYYALNITVPDNPEFLWTFTADDNPNVGYTYGTPMITKLDGKWVVLVSSGYNNVPEGTKYVTADGKGHVWALNAENGTVDAHWQTGEGSTTKPSGLSGINIKVMNFQGDNSMETAYGGDLFGNMWRFNKDGSTSRVIKLNQPITVAPEIGDIKGKTVLLFGTGRYLGTEDLENTDIQSFYAVKDKQTSESSTSKMAQKTISGASSVTGSEPDWDSADGWYVNLPVQKERVNLSAQLYFGTVIFATTIPAASECQPGGSGRLYFLNYETGGRIDNYDVYMTMNSPVVGFTVAKIAGGTPVIYPITADGGFPTAPPPVLPIGAGLGVDSGKRIMWRELVN